MALTLVPDHPKDRYAWCYSINPGEYREMPGHLLDAERATQVAAELTKFGIESTIIKYPQGGHAIRVAGAANVDKFDSRLPEKEWAARTIALAYDHVNRQPVSDGIALLARHGGGSEDARMECIASALQHSGIGNAEKKMVVLGHTMRSPILLMSKELKQFTVQFKQHAASQYKNPAHYQIPCHPVFITGSTLLERK